MHSWIEIQYASTKLNKRDLLICHLKHIRWVFNLCHGHGLCMHGTYRQADGRHRQVGDHSTTNADSFSWFTNSYALHLPRRPDRSSLPPLFLHTSHIDLCSGCFLNLEFFLQLFAWLVPPVHLDLNSKVIFFLDWNSCMAVIFFKFKGNTRYKRQEEVWQVVD